MTAELPPSQWIVSEIASELGIELTPSEIAEVAPLIMEFAFEKMFGRRNRLIHPSTEQVKNIIRKAMKKRFRRRLPKAELPVAGQHMPSL